MGIMAITGLVVLAILLIALYVVCGVGTYLLVESVSGDKEKFQNDLDAPARWTIVAFWPLLHILICIVGAE
jgi:uncharacterized membrane protein HdeD (DUF308 family)